ncbi:hypothetical protein AGMMS49965_11510 [Bacteroidia bacterium]|nr:hypothetical protein AGMMS49965_11510 [Bacteroidia bacterium]
MKVYFYHHVSIKECYEDWKKAQYPGHLLYGMTHLPQCGVDVIYHTIPFNPYIKRLRLCLYNLKKILLCKESFDAIYAVSHYGLEFIILLRAIGLFKKPIVIWHHTAIIVPKNRIKRVFSKLFYKGIDTAFFFSQPLLEQSIATGKIQKKNAFVVPWGADLAFYDALIQTRNPTKRYISTGRERRDFVTLIRAFNQTTEDCEIYTTPNGGYADCDYQTFLAQETINPNVQVFFVGAKHLEMAKIVNDAFVVVNSCLNYPYTIGLTSVVEAMALGLPLITTDNPTYPIDVEKENMGLKVPYGDVDAWVKAIQYLSTHPEKAKEMGDNARSLAEKQYNLDRCTKEIASVLLSVI